MDPCHGVSSADCPAALSPETAATAATLIFGSLSMAAGAADRLLDLQSAGWRTHDGAMPAPWRQPVRTQARSGGVAEARPNLRAATPGAA